MEVVSPGKEDEDHDYVWFGVDDDYRIVIPWDRFKIPWDRFKEEAAVESRGMMAFKGEQIE